jgi:hypothetical protein
LAEDTIVANAIASSSLHPTAASINETAVKEDHHHRGRNQPPLPSTMTAIAAVNNKKQPLASGGRRCQLCGSGNGDRQWQRQLSLSTAAAVGLSQQRRWQRRQLWQRLMAAATMASLPMPPTTTTAILALIALALPWTRIGRRGGGRADTRLICRRQGCCHWCHLCLHSRDDGTTEDGRGDRRGRNADIHGREEVGHHDPIGVEVMQGQPVQRDNQPAC